MEGGVRRQLVNSRQLSPIRETRDRERGREMTKSKVGTSTIFARDRRCSEKGGTHKASEWVGREILAGSRFPGIPGGSPFHTPDATTSQRFQPTKDSALPFKRYKRRFATIPSPSALLASFQNETQIVVELENIVRDFRIPG